MRKRLLLAFSIVIIVTVAVGAVGIISLFILERTRDDLLISGASNEAIMNSSYQLILITSAIMVAVLLVGVILAIVFARQISRSIRLPMQKMLDVVEQVGATGNLSFPEELKRSVRDDGNYNDEVGRLSHGFAKMMDDIMEKVAVLERAATGDLTRRAPSASADDTLANATNTLIANLNTMADEVRAAIDQMGAGIGQISQGAQSLAQSTMEQSTTMEGLMQTLNEVSNQAEDNAKHSQEASDITTAVWSSAEEGRDSMDKMTQAMEEINAASQSISVVIKAIDDIAFQTNILSLNAAVEAARAGQHGRGFAVVADEVRNLATKSASAAKDTSALIEDTIGKSGMGSNIVKDTFEYLNKIMNGVSESTWLLKNIATATAEQNESIETINKGFGQLSDVVHQNSATAEQSAAATQQMSSQTAVLLDLVNRFKTDKEYEARERQFPVSPAHSDDRPDVLPFGREEISGWPDEQRVADTPDASAYPDAKQNVSAFGGDEQEAPSFGSDEVSGLPDASNVANTPDAPTHPGDEQDVPSFGSDEVSGLPDEPSQLTPEAFTLDDVMGSADDAPPPMKVAEPETDQAPWKDDESKY
ncbi:MAG: methyl-accepting chemotaxis protein [Clostridiales Family XIII bacterium]|nr:methyl-accepting chemotaxis protein [Clostridiales Family XIII bacterium]